eukprot:CAMPEP_0172468130 /NCGR_PEP_ID=MMETSP1065-20121228/60764_1 /TAXON_ID=265537 /ORGANISM="Amphiprora paludosa, Strain CCMP125" /LENGTH=58 /DNA_ID=CAMNT_0013225469 /DNA_START=38 /DNA_END=211 /DNA_ORIENTATION=+
MSHQFASWGGGISGRRSSSMMTPRTTDPFFLWTSYSFCLLGWDTSRCLTTVSSSSGGL